MTTQTCGHMTRHPLYATLVRCASKAHGPDVGHVYEFPGARTDLKEKQ